MNARKKTKFFFQSSGFPLNSCLLEYPDCSGLHAKLMTLHFWQKHYGTGLPACTIFIQSNGRKCKFYINGECNKRVLFQHLIQRKELHKLVQLLLLLFWIVCDSYDTKCTTSVSCLPGNALECTRTLSLYIRWQWRGQQTYLMQHEHIEINKHK